MLIRVYLLLIVIFSFCCTDASFAYLRVIEEFRNNMEPVVTGTLDSAKLHGAKRVHKNGEKGTVLLVHGFVEKEKIMTEMAMNFYEKGYNVVTFNMRGHGSINDKIGRSIAPEGHYSFDHIVAYDIPAMIESAIRETYEIPVDVSVRDFKLNNPITFIGHSMGGQAAKASLAGARMSSDGKMFISYADRKWMEKKVRLIALASPASFNDASFLYKLGSGILDFFPKILENTGRKMVFKITNGFVNILSIDGGVVEKISIVNFIRRINGIIMPSELTKEQILWALRSVGKVEEQLLIQSLEWRYNGYKSRCGIIDYENLKLFEGESLMVAIEGDRLANPKSIREYVGRELGNPKVRFVKVLGNGSHIDGIIGKGLKKVFPTLLNFAEHGLKMISNKDLMIEAPFDIVNNPASESWKR